MNYRFVEHFENLFILIGLNAIFHSLYMKFNYIVLNILSINKSKSIHLPFKETYWLEQYSWALFKAMSHMLCIGYGR